MAGRIPDSFIDELVARSDIVDIIGARVALKKAGRAYKACCPFHNEKTPSFSVNPDKQFFHCFGCGVSGSVIGFLMQYEKMEFLDAIADLAQRAGLELPREAQPARDPASADLHDVLGLAARFFAQNLADDPRALGYVRARGIDTKTSTTFVLGYAPDSWTAVLNRFGVHAQDRARLLQVGLIKERDTSAGESTAGFYDRFRDRLMFPIRDARGRVIGFGGRVIDRGDPKYLNSPETALFHKSRELYGLYEARQARKDFARLLVVEGYMDVVRLHQAGITYAVATLGTATTPEHLIKIFRLTREVVFCFDGDRAGRQAAWRALENSLPVALDGREFKFMFLPEGHDPDSLVAAEGAQAFETRLQSALPLSDYLVQQLMLDVDLEHPGGRAKLKALVAPLFSRMPDGVYRDMLAAQLAARVSMPVKALKTALSSDPQRSTAQVPRNQRRISAGRGNLLSQAITLVIQHPGAAASVHTAEALGHLSRPGVGVLQELLRQAASMPSPNTAGLLERWRDRPEYHRLTQLAQADSMVTEGQGAIEELRMAVEKLLEEYGPGRRVDELLQKAAELGLNYDEKTELSLLLKSKGRPRAPG